MYAQKKRKTLHDTFAFQIFNSEHVYLITASTSTEKALLLQPFVDVVAFFHAILHQGIFVPLRRLGPLVTVITRYFLTGTDFFQSNHSSDLAENGVESEAIERVRLERVADFVTERRPVIRETSHFLRNVEDPIAFEMKGVIRGGEVIALRPRNAVEKSQE